MEVSEIAAIVSLNEIRFRQKMVLKPLSQKTCQEKKYKTKSDLVFELVESGWLDNDSELNFNDPLKPQAMFTINSSNFSNEDETLFPTRDMFWKILRSSGCDQVIHLLASVLYQVIESNKVMNLIHHGEKIVNILIANTGAIDISDIKHLEPTIIVPNTAHLNQIQTKNNNKNNDKNNNAEDYVVVPLFSTYSDKQSLGDAALLVGIDVRASSAQRLKRDNETRYTHLKQILQVEGDCLLPHWWLCLITESRKMIHMDLCGPAYDIFEYKDSVLDMYSGEYCGIAPLHIFETDEYQLIKGEDEFMHKLAMRNVIWPSIVRQLPTSIRHFNSVKKGLPIEFTPLETYLTMHAKTPSTRMKKEWKKISDFICNVHCLGTYLQPGSGIKVKIMHQEKEEKSIVGKVIERDAKQRNKIIIHAMLQGFKEAVTVDCSSTSVSIFPPPFISSKPFKSLEAIHAEIQEAEMYEFSPECHVTIHGLQSEEGMVLNGCEGIVIRDALIKPPPYGETRWKVQLIKSKEIKSIAGKNLLKHHLEPALGKKKLDKKKAAKLLLSDPIAQEFLRLLRLGNAGFTVVCDPKYRTVVWSLLDTGVIPDNDMFEEALKIADHPKGESFRQMFIRMKTSGVDPRELEDPDYDRFLKILSKWGLFRPRSVS